MILRYMERIFIIFDVHEHIRDGSYKAFNEIETCRWVSYIHKTVYKRFIAFFTPVWWHPEDVFREFQNILFDCHTYISAVPGIRIWSCLKLFLYILNRCEESKCRYISGVHKKVFECSLLNRNCVIHVWYSLRLLVEGSMKDRCHIQIRAKTGFRNIPFPPHAEE